MKKETKYYLLFLWIAFGSFLSYYCMLAQTNYWIHFYDQEFVTVFSAIFCSAEMFGGFLAIWMGTGVPIKRLCYINFILSIFALAVLIPFHYITLYWLKYLLTLIPIAFCGVLASVFYARFLGYSSKVGQIYSQAICLGCGIASIVIQLAEDIITFIFNDESERSLINNALCYYSITCLIFISCIMSFIYLENLINAELSKTTDVKQTELHDTLVVELQEDVLQIKEQTQMTTLQIIKKVFLISISCCTSYINMCITFPLFILRIPCYFIIKKYGEVTNQWWNLILLSLVWASDCLGRLVPLSKLVQKIITTKIVIALGFIRLIFLVLIPLMVFPLANIDSQVFPILRNDIISISILIIMGFSSSFTCTLGYMKYQDYFTEQQHLEKERAGLIVNVFMEMGIFSGSMISLVLIPLFK